MSLKVISLILAGLMLIGLSGCAGLIEEDSPLHQNTVSMIKALIHDDAEAAYELVSAATTREAFDAVYPNMQMMLQDVQNFSLLPTNRSKNITNGVTSDKVTYRLTTENGTYTVTASMVTGQTGLASFHIAPEGI